LPWKKFWGNFRQANFTLLFGAAAPTFARTLKQSNFTEEECDNVIDMYGLQGSLNAMIADKQGKMTPLECKYLIVASTFRELFFKTYPGLEVRIKREQDHAIAKGYTRFWRGPVRHVPELRYMKFSSKGGLILGDKKYYSKMAANLKNIASNTCVQGDGTYYAFTDWHCVEHNLRKWGFKSRTFNGVHDSIDLYIYVPETRVVSALLNACQQTKRKPFVDIPMGLDMEMADLSTPALLKSQYYKHGKGHSLKEYDIDVELREWNNEHGTSFVFENTIPI
jgi:hypothetical protein